MAELCINCSNFVETLDGAPRDSSKVPKNFGSYAQIKAAASACALCSLIYRYYGDIAKHVDRNRSSQFSCSTLEPGFSLIHLETGWLDQDPPELGTDLDMRLLVSYQKDSNSTDNPKPNATAEHPIWQPGSLSMETRFNLVDQWISICLLKHTLCRGTTSTYPSRLLDLHEVENGYIHLVDVKSLATPLPGYITLSYCWGNHQATKPSKENLTKHQDKIPIVDLPKTLRDAIQISQRLKINYLWIDALCIIQDSSEDWEVEAERMGKIYQSSLLTISATSSSSSNGGCFIDKRDSGTLGAISKTASNGYKYSARVRVHRHSFENHLVKRGWTLQETVLSKRILHLTSNQMYWQCKDGFFSEDWSLSTGVCGRLRKSDSFSLDVFKTTWHGDIQGRSGAGEVFWHTLCSNYSQRAFTFINDRLPALSGVIEYYQSERQESCLLGVWPSSIHIDLAWSAPSVRYDVAKAVENGKDCGLPDLPSWTWLSVPGEVNYAFRASVTDPIKALDVNDWKFQWAGRPYVSCLTDAKLLVTSKILHFTVAVVSGASARGVVGHDGIRCSNLFDGHRIITNRQEIMALVLYTSSLVATYLMLQPAVEIGAYMRIGIGNLVVDESGSLQSFLAKFKAKTIQLA